ncbi:hypothetical protein FBUS_06766, partial [Fasciolopsis buskii]
NKALKTIQIALLGTENCTNSSGEGEVRQEVNVDCLRLFEDFLNSRILPVFDRLPLRNIQVPSADELPDFERDWDHAVQLAKLFSSACDKELPQLERLADLAEHLRDQLRDTFIPQWEARSQQIDHALRLLVHEFSLRFEQIERQWLIEYQQLQQRK